MIGSELDAAVSSVQHTVLLADDLQQYRQSRQLSLAIGRAPDLGNGIARRRFAIAALAHPIPLSPVVTIGGGVQHHANVHEGIETLLGSELAARILVNGGVYVALAQAGL